MEHPETVHCGDLCLGTWQDWREHRVEIAHRQFN